MGNGLLNSACLIEPPQKRRGRPSHNTANADNTDDQCDRRSQRLRLALVNPGQTAYAFSTGLLLWDGKAFLGNISQILRPCDYRQDQGTDRKDDKREVRTERNARR
jgi:hypothetical protein